MRLGAAAAGVLQLNLGLNVGEVGAVSDLTTYSVRRPITGRALNGPATATAEPDCTVMQEQVYSTPIPSVCGANVFTSCCDCNCVGLPSFHDSHTWSGFVNSVQSRRNGLHLPTSITNTSHWSLIYRGLCAKMAEAPASSDACAQRGHLKVSALAALQRQPAQPHTR
jgi:hypothetical protein